MRKLFKNLVSSVLPQIVNIVSNLILPGLIISQFGSDINGLVSTTKTVVSYISLVGAGIATATTQALYQPVANKEENIVKGMLRSADSMFNRYGWLFIIITLLLSLVYPLVIQSDIPYLVVSSLLIVMSISGASEFFAIGRCRAFLYAHQKVYVCSLIQAGSLLIGLVLSVILLVLNCDIIMVQCAASIVYVLRGILLVSYINKQYPQYIDYKTYDPVSAATKKRKDAMIHQLAGLVVTGSQSALLTILIDLKAASIYSVYNIVLYGIRNICSSLCTSITPFLGREYALKQKGSLRDAYNVLELLFFFFTTFVLTVTVVLLVPFVTLYTKNADVNYVYPTFALLFVISSSFYILKLPGTALINVAGHFRETRSRALAEAVLSVILSIFFIILLGKEGVLIGTGVAVGWRCVDTIIYVDKYILKQSCARSLFRLGISLLNVLFFKLISVFWIFEITNYLEWIVVAAIYSVVVLLFLCIQVVLWERKTILFIKNILRKKSFN